MSIFSIALLIFGVSQIYWAWLAYRFANARIRSRPLLWTLCVLALAVYFVEYQFNLGAWRERVSPVHLTPQDALLAAPFLWWAASSFFAFLLVTLFAIPRGIVYAARRLLRKRQAAAPDIQSPARRDLLQKTAAIAAAAPFVAGAYGLLYGRLNLEVTPQKIHLPRLPRAFEGFRICQLSDIHIGPFMPADEIRKYVAIANSQKADMIVLTGDFVTFDPDTQDRRGGRPARIARALWRLRQPGQPRCLGRRGRFHHRAFPPGGRAHPARRQPAHLRQRRVVQPDRRGFPESLTASDPPPRCHIFWPILKVWWIAIA